MNGKKGLNFFRRGEPEPPLGWRLWFKWLCVALTVSACQATREALAEEEITVGRNAAGQIKALIEFEPPLALEASIFPGIPGFATGELAFHSTLLDDPANNFFQRSTAADFQFVLLAKDPGMEVWNDTGTRFMATNNTFFIGQPPFDSHPLWNLVNGLPGNVYSLTLKLRDVNSVYAESEPFALSFTPGQVLYRININQIDSLHATLTWSTNPVGWELQSAALMAAENWDTVTNVPGIAGANFSLSISTAGPQKFFRLRRQ